MHFSGTEHLGWFWTLAIGVSFNNNQENRAWHLLLIVHPESPGFQLLPFTLIYHFNPAALPLLTRLPTVKETNGSLMWWDALPQMFSVQNFFYESTWSFPCSLECRCGYVNKHFQNFWEQSTWMLHQMWSDACVIGSWKRADDFSSVTTTKEGLATETHKLSWLLICGGCVHTLPSLTCARVRGIRPDLHPSW